MIEVLLKIAAPFLRGRQGDKLGCSSRGKGINWEQANIFGWVGGLGHFLFDFYNTTFC